MSAITTDAVERSTLFQRFFMNAMSSVPAVETSLPVISAE